MSSPTPARRWSRHPSLLPLCALTVAALLPALAADAKADLLVSQAAMETQSNYRYSYEVTDQGGATTKFVMEFVRPDRRHQTFAGFEMIMIGKDGWTRVGDVWKQMDAAQAALLNHPGAAAAATAMDKETVTLEGADTLDGRAVNVYHSLYADTGVTSDSRYWVGVEDHLTYKISGATDATAMNVEGVGKSTLVGVYQYNVPGLSIEAPK